MFMTCRAGRLAVLVAATLGTSIWAACALDDRSAPGLTSPSGFSTSVTLTASRDSVPRDGSADVTVTVRDSDGPLEAQRFSVATDIGTVSQSEITTGSDGRATFTFVAPAARVPGGSAVISVVPLGANTDASIPRRLTISFTGATNATAPTASFTMSPTAPVLRQNVVLDASATTDEGALCGDLCTYSWDFGGEATASGRVITYQFLAVRTYPVTLTVTDAQGSTGTLTQNLTVTQGTAPTASFTFSPASPGQFETVNFTAEASRVGEAGRTITSYQWRYGDGASDTGVTDTHSYSVIGAYPVVLTVTDNAGVQGTSTQTVTVVAGVTAAFTLSPTDPVAGGTVILNAEASRGSSSGFAGRNPIVKYIWNFGTSTGTTETTSPIISTTFPSASTYTVNLTVEDSAGRRQTTSMTITVL